MVNGYHLFLSSVDWCSIPDGFHLDYCLLGISHRYLGQDDASTRWVVK